MGVLDDNDTLGDAAVFFATGGGSSWLGGDYTAADARGDLWSAVFGAPDQTNPAKDPAPGPATAGVPSSPSTPSSVAPSSAGGVTTSTSLLDRARAWGTANPGKAALGAGAVVVGLGMLFGVGRGR